MTLIFNFRGQRSWAGLLLLKSFCLRAVIPIAIGSERRASYLSFLSTPYSIRLSAIFLNRFMYKYRSKPAVAPARFASISRYSIPRPIPIRYCSISISTPQAKTPASIRKVEGMRFPFRSTLQQARNASPKYMVICTILS